MVQPACGAQQAINNSPLRASQLRGARCRAARASQDTSGTASPKGGQSPAGPMGRECKLIPSCKAVVIHVCYLSGHEGLKNLTDFRMRKAGPSGVCGVASAGAARGHPCRSRQEANAGHSRRSERRSVFEVGRDEERSGLLYVSKRDDLCTTVLTPRRAGRE
jgi:hypothetical protein